MRQQPRTTSVQQRPKTISNGPTTKTDKQQQTTTTTTTTTKTDNQQPTITTTATTTTNNNNDSNQQQTYQEDRLVKKGSGASADCACSKFTRHLLELFLMCFTIRAYCWKESIIKRRNFYRPGFYFSLKDKFIN